MRFNPDTWVTENWTFPQNLAERRRPFFDGEEERTCQEDRDSRLTGCCARCPRSTTACRSRSSVETLGYAGWLSGPEAIAGLVSVSRRGSRDRARGLGRRRDWHPGPNPVHGSRLPPSPSNTSSASEHGGGVGW